MNIQHNVPLSEHTSMRLGGNALQFVEITHKNDIPEIINYARSNNLKVQVIGEGTNTLFTDAGFSGIVIKNGITGLDIDTKTGIVSVGAGENWNELVHATVELGLVGIESMALIPGTVGATPVNNVGAYGQEIKDTLIEVVVFDIEANGFASLSNQQCNFGYRSSRFKDKDYGRFIICEVTLQLQKNTPTYSPPKYDSLLNALEAAGNNSPTSLDVMNTVIELRSQKLPDPKVLANTGSFFKNPIISSDQAEMLKQRYPDMPQYPTSDNQVKIAAGWLIEKAGLKGFQQNGMRVYEQQALVLINDSAYSFADLVMIKDHIQSAINEMFGIQLDPEPEIISP